MKKQPNSKASKQTIVTELQTLNDKIDTTRVEINTVRQEINNRISFLAVAIQKNEGDIHNLAQTVSTKEDIRSILDSIDAFTNKIIVHDRKTLVHDHRLNELEPVVQDHEKRLLALESSPK